jgi:hypothetical protein
MKKHWTHYLPEAGKITKKGDEAIYQEMILSKLESDVAQQKRKVASIENELFCLARQDWTIEEITQAKLDAKKRR